MPLPVIPNTYRVALNWSTEDGRQTAENVMHIENDVAGDNSETVAGDVVSALSAGTSGTGSAFMFNAVSTHAAIRSLDVTKLDGLSATFHQAITPVPGDDISDFLPAVAGVVTLRTAVRGRNFRGRSFIPFMSEAGVFDGAIDATQLANMQTGWNAFLAALQPTDDSTLVIASYVVGNINAVTTCTVQPILGTQRRRQSRLR